MIDLLPDERIDVIAIYENGEMIDSLVKDDATPENVENMIKKHIG